MITVKNVLCLCLCLVLIAACNSPKKDIDKSPSFPTKFHPSVIEQAEKFSIDYFENIVHVVISEPFKAAENSLDYYLIPKGQSIPDSLTDENIIRIPIERFACTSTTHLPSLDLLDCSKRLTAFPSHNLVSSEAINRQIKAGKVAELGKDYSLNTELLIEVNPELLMTFTLDGNFKHLAPATKAGIATIVNADYLETTPLGRAEWIKLFGVLFG